jgi:hypothetical protein
MKNPISKLMIAVSLGSLLFSFGNRDEDEKN